MSADAAHRSRNSDPSVLADTVTVSVQDHFSTLSRHRLIAADVTITKDEKRESVRPLLAMPDERRIDASHTKPGNASTPNI